MRILTILTILTALNVPSTVRAQAKNNELIEPVTFQGRHYIACKFNPKRYLVEMFNRNDRGDVYTFQSLLARKSHTLIFAMNAGMYEKDLSPVGLFVSEGKTIKPINLAANLPGNFYQLKPNGIFILDDQNIAHIITSESYASIPYHVKLATQSGPMLLIDGAINNNFSQRSTNINIRNAIGVDNQGNAVFIISTDKVNFYELAQLFKERYNCSNAL